MYFDIGEIFFSVLITYMGAVELAFLAQNFVHWIFRHREANNVESLEELQRKVENEIKEAESKEVCGLNAMKDGVLYKDGFRVDSDLLANPTFRPDFVAELRRTLGTVERNEMERELIGASNEHIDKDNESEKREEAHEEPCIKKNVKRLSASPAPAENLTSNNEKSEYHERTELSEETSRTQDFQSEELQEPPSSSTITSSLGEPCQIPDLAFDEFGREEPDGQDSQGLKYSEEYLRSLDGIKHRPLVREDGTGRRRAFRKRLSIDSTSSRESRASREEELKMFTSLEEEEFEAIRKGETDYVPIRYTSEPSLKVKKHHRRHRKSPIKDSSRKLEDDDSRSSTERYDAEEVNPWGDVLPEHYKDTEFWKREKAISIEEEDANITPGLPIPKTSSFEEATDTQNEKALKALRQRESSKYENEREKSPYDTRKSAEKNVSKDDVADTLADGYPNAYDQPASHDTLKAQLKSDVYIEISSDFDLPREPEISLKTEEYFSTELQLSPERLSPHPKTVTLEVRSPELMEGISDFYDFNASINPSRSRSRSMSRDKSIPRSKSKSPHRPSSSNSVRSIGRFPIVPLDAKGVEGLSDFYDYCVLLNRKCYGYSANGNTTHCSENSSINLLLRDHDLNQSNKDNRIGTSHSKNGVIQEEDTGGTSDLKTDASEINPKAATPTTPGSEVSFVSVPSYVERMKDEYRSNAFMRSLYPGESMDFSDSFENLREEARHFRRSRSKSRSVDGDIKKLTGQELQAKILEEISRTTIDYQDFSKNINQTFIDRERRGSDSALLHKPEILIQIQDERENSYSEDDDGIMNLEAEEYHHFRRFSLNQEYQVEEYPTDDYVYVEKVEVRSKGGVRRWIREDFYDLDHRPHLEMPMASIESTDESDRAEAEDLESGSDDERQTVVEVEDDILDNIKSDTPNDDFSEEETKLFVEKYHWKDEEAIGGSSEEDDNVANLGFSQENATEFKKSGAHRKYSAKADIPIRPATIRKTFRIDHNTDGLPNTLKKGAFDQGENAKWGLNTSRSPNKELSAALIENERNLEAYVAASSATSPTKSKRLRTRYGIGTGSSSYLSYEAADNYASETTQVKPKKEYNWRKNFRLDDDEEPPKSDKKLSFSIETKTEEETGPAEDFLDPRKLSLGGESITLYTRSPDRIKDFDFSGGNFEETFDELGEENAANVDEEFQSMFEQQAVELEENEGVPKVLNERLNRTIADEEVEINMRVGDVGGFLKETQQEAIANLALEQEISAETKKSKKKKGKKKSASVEDEVPETTIADEAASLSKKKSKKKRRSAEKEDVAPKKSPSPPSTAGSEIKQTQAAPTRSSPGSYNKPPASPSSSVMSEATTSAQPQKATSPQPQKATSPLPRSEFNPSTSPKKTVERQQSSGAYELIKDGSMYPWF